MEIYYNHRLLRDQRFPGQANIYIPSLLFGSGYEWVRFLHWHRKITSTRKSIVLSAYLSSFFNATNDALEPRPTKEAVGSRRACYVSIYSPFCVSTACNSSIFSTGEVRCIIAWQFGQTGRRSFTGSSSYSLPISAMGFRWWTWINPLPKSP